MDEAGTDNENTSLKDAWRELLNNVVSVAQGIHHVMFHPAVDADAKVRFYRACGKVSEAFSGDHGDALFDLTQKHRWNVVTRANGLYPVTTLYLQIKPESVNDYYADIYWKGQPFPVSQPTIFETLLKFTLELDDFTTSAGFRFGRIKDVEPFREGDELYRYFQSLDNDLVANWREHIDFAANLRVSEQSRSVTASLLARLNAEITLLNSSSDGLRNIEKASEAINSSQRQLLQDKFFLEVNRLREERNDWANVYIKLKTHPLNNYKNHKSLTSAFSRWESNR